MSKTAEMTVWAQDPFSYDIIPPSFTVFRKPDLRKVNARDIFVSSSVADLPAVSEFVRAANHRTISAPFSSGRMTTLGFYPRCFTRQNSESAAIFLSTRIRRSQSAC